MIQTDVARIDDRGLAISPPRVTHEVDRAVIWLLGEHDVTTAMDLYDTLAAEVDGNDRDLVVDLSGATFLGSATLRALLSCRNLLHGGHRTLTLRSPTRSARRLLDICGLEDLVEVPTSSAS